MVEVPHAAVKTEADIKVAHKARDDILRDIALNNRPKASKKLEKGKKAEKNAAKKLKRKAGGAVKLVL